MADIKTLMKDLKKAKINVKLSKELSGWLDMHKSYSAMDSRDVVKAFVRAGFRPMSSPEFRGSGMDIKLSDGKRRITLSKSTMSPVYHIHMEESRMSVKESLEKIKEANLGEGLNDIEAQIMRALNDYLTVVKKDMSKGFNDFKKLKKKILGDLDAFRTKFQESVNEAVKKVEISIADGGGSLRDAEVEVTVDGDDVYFGTLHRYEDDLIKAIKSAGDTAEENQQYSYKGAKANKVHKILKKAGMI